MKQSVMVNTFSGRPDSFSAEEEHRYSSAKAESQWQWDRDAQKMSPHLYSDGQGGNAGRSLHPNQIQDTKMGSMQEQRVHPQDQDMEVGYEESPTTQTLETLDQKFHKDIMKLTKEQDVMEDAENARHKEKILEINTQYQERLSALRARHASRREELLRRESQARLQAYQQQAAMSPYQNNLGPGDMIQGHRGYGGPDLIHGETRREYGGPAGGAPFDSFRQRQESFGRGRMQGANTRVPTPGGRVYNTGPRFY